jgi:hypothetical protein
MARLIAKREFLAAGLGLGSQQGPHSRRMILAVWVNPRRRKCRLCAGQRSPGWPNTITADPEHGFWVQEQRHDDLTDILYHRHREIIASPPLDPEVAGLG